MKEEEEVVADDKFVIFLSFFDFVFCFSEKNLLLNTIRFSKNLHYLTD